MRITFPATKQIISQAPARTLKTLTFPWTNEFSRYVNMPVVTEVTTLFEKMSLPELEAAQCFEDTSSRDCLVLRKPANHAWHALSRSSTTRTQTSPFSASSQIRTFRFQKQQCQHRDLRAFLFKHLLVFTRHPSQIKKFKAQDESICSSWVYARRGQLNLSMVRNTKAYSTPERFHMLPHLAQHEQTISQALATFHSSSHMETELFRRRCNEPQHNLCLMLKAFFFSGTNACLKYMKHANGNRSGHAPLRESDCALDW